MDLQLNPLSSDSWSRNGHVLQIRRLPGMPRSMTGPFLLCPIRPCKPGRLSVRSSDGHRWRFSRFRSAVAAWITSREAVVSGRIAARRPRSRSSLVHLRRGKMDRTFGGPMEDIFDERVKLVLKVLAPVRTQVGLEHRDLVLCDGACGFAIRLGGRAARLGRLRGDSNGN
jgi:hypothetical protein